MMHCQDLGGGARRWDNSLKMVLKTQTVLLFSKARAFILHNGTGRAASSFASNIFSQEHGLVVSDLDLKIL
jgi:hypothetical protein